MSSSIAEIFEKEGELLQVSGNNPILLEGRQNVWLILSGHAEVFAVQLDNDHIVGQKKHYFGVQEGQILFGMDLDSYGMGQGFQAVGFPGTLVARLDLERIMELCSDKAYKCEISDLIDAWITGLSKGLTMDVIPRPRPDVLLEPGYGIAIEEDKISYPGKGILWVRYKSGRGLFLGMEDFSPESPARLLPLCEKSWIQVLDDSSVDTLTTEEALDSGNLWHALDHFFDLIFQILLFNTRFDAVDKFNLLKEKQEMDQSARETGLVKLVSVLKKKPLLNLDEEFDDHLLAACALVGKRLGMTFRQTPKEKRQEGRRTYTIEGIARLWRVNVRKVSLGGEWWRRDNGPLVGFMEENKSPVALLPLSHRRYEMVDPATGTSQVITGKEAEALSPFAYTFYRYLPERLLTSMDLLKLGLQECRKDLLWVILLGSAIGVLSLIFPLVTDLIFTDLIPGAERSRLLELTVIFACFGITTIMFEITRNIAILRMENKLGHTVEAAVFDRILRLPIPFFRQFTAGNLAMRGMGVSMMRQVVTGVVITGIVGSFFSIFNYFILFYYHRNLALVATIPLALFIAVILAMGLLQLKYYRQMADIEGKISGMVLQFLNSITKLRVSGSEDRVFSIWANSFSQQKKMAYKGGIYGNILTVFSVIFPLLSLMIIFSWLFLKEETGLDTGDFLAFIAAYTTLQVAIVQIVISLNIGILAIPFFERIRPILENVPEVDTVKTDPGELNGRIELYQLYFRYLKDGPYVLKGVSMLVEPGEFVAIVGPSGSGKSTLLRLLLGFEKPEAGTIYYDNQDLAELDVNRVRQNMGVVLQGGNLMAGDIFRNIVGSYPLSHDDAWEAARMAGLEQDIKEMPMGMNTMVMEGASTLSGGQRQRMMIARAIVNRPRVLLFDEATSALDNRTQAIVSESLQKMKSTRIVIAHRLSTIMDADQIYVMDAGEIVESGTYEELMAKEGVFEKLAKRQVI